MKSQEPGVLPQSEYMFITPAPDTRKDYYYATWCGHYICNRRYRIDRPFFPDALLVYIIAGEMDFSLGDETVRAGRGDVVLMNCNRPHSYQAPVQAEFLYYNFNGQNTAGWVDRIIAENGSILFRKEFNRNIYSQMAGQIGQLLGGGPTDPVGISQNIYNCLCYLAKRQILQIDPRGTSLSAQALRFMRAHLGEPISLSDIAAAVGLSPYYFSRRFREEVGDTPANCLINLRVQQAQLWLRTGDMTVEEIAERLGYSNPSSFSNIFTQKTGMTPRQFRKIVI